MSILTSTDKAAVIDVLNSIGVPAALVDVQEGQRFVTFALNRLAEEFLKLRDADVFGTNAAGMDRQHAQSQRIQQRFEECVRLCGQVRFQQPAPIDVAGERRLGNEARIRPRTSGRPQP